MAEVVASKLLKVVTEKLITRILNIEYDAGPVAKWLKKGDELCKGRMTPMSTQLTQKVSDICKRCRNSKYDTGLMLVLEMGLMDMVWGFIECAKQTNTNLETDEMGDGCVQDFFWLYNYNEKTAFDIAIEKDHVEVARILLNNASHRCLTLQWNKRRKTLLHLLNVDPIFDGFIFDMLKEEKERKVKSTSATVQIDCQRDHLKTRDKGASESLDNLSNDLLGTNARKITVLHLISKVGNIDSVRDILERDSSQIICHNSDMETPAYVAAREGRADILGYMINFVKQMNQDIESIVTRSIDKHNALHIAIQNHHVEVVFLLLEEIPQLASRINESKESPLYLAAERRYFGVLELTLRWKK